MNNNKHLISNKKERIRVMYSLGIFALLAGAVIYLITHTGNQSSLISARALRKMGGSIGELAAYGFGFSISMYVIRRVVKRITSKEIKQKLLVLARITREWHVPISIIAFGIIILHAYIMLSRGLFLNLRYISGLLALGVLGVQILSGIFRYKKIGVKFHMVTGIAFIIFMIIHLMT
ncbi:hypothetical protein HMPREF1982_04593 [Clostridiales bacterium oral taxon 876 str. F0540]|nr:hypothetical protein HMPREF1982_04593 [Clostridiales bacterium oral taxon 876 str. F0540]